MKPQPNVEWYETIMRAKPGVRVMGIISMDNHKPREFYARMIVLDESDYGENGVFSGVYRGEKLKKGLAELKKIKSWNDLSSSDYFDFALNNRMYYANDPNDGSPTIQHAYTQLMSAMKAIVKGYK